jgi:hypothetical protein
MFGHLRNDRLYEQRLAAHVRQETFHVDLPN